MCSESLYHILRSNLYLYLSSKHTNLLPTKKWLVYVFGQLCQLLLCHSWSLKFLVPSLSKIMVTSSVQGDADCSIAFLLQASKMASFGLGSLCEHWADKFIFPGTGNLKLGKRDNSSPDICLCIHFLCISNPC